MTDPQPNQPPAPTVEDKILPKAQIETEAHTSAADKPSEVVKLTPEEQMALFEKELKENDWGHQPC